MRFQSVFAFSLSTALALAAACSSPAARVEGDDEDAATSSSSSGGRQGSSSSSGSGGASSSSSSGDAAVDPGDVCENELALYRACGFDEGVQCRVDGYVANCHANNDATESAQRIAARNACLGSSNCEPDDRKDCIYRQYNSATLSAAQEALLQRYCETCEASDVAGCTSRTRTYSPSAGIDSVDTIFLAAWELAPDLVEKIDANCIDEARDGDAGTCAKRFNVCAGGYYIDALVECE